MQRFTFQRGYLLRTRAMWLGCVAFIFLLVAQLGVRYYVNLPVMLQLIEAADNKDRLRVDNALAQRLALYQSRVADNALWNDAFEFVTQPNDAFIESNFDQRTLVDNELDGVIFLDTQGNVIWHYGLHIHYDGHGDAPLLQPPVSNAQLLEAFYIEPQKPVLGKFETRQGYIKARAGALIYSASPIFPTNLGGGALNSRGTLVMWAWLDDEYFESLAEQTKLDLTAQFLERGGAALESSSRHLLSQPENVRNTDNQLAWLLKDIDGEPLFLLSIQFEALGPEYRLFSQSILIGVIAALLLLVGLALAVKFWLVRPLTAMGQQMDDITESGSYENRLAIKSYGELERLAGQFNLLLDEVCRQQDLARKKHAKLHLASISDGLTGLANRRYLDQFMDESWEKAKAQRSTYSLILIDIDFFKKYNDSYGHAAGDRVLSQVGQLLQSFQPNLEALTARYGGEEFSMVLVGASCEAVEALCQCLCAAVREQKITHAGSSFGYLTISVGAVSIFAGEPLPEYLSGPNPLRTIFKAADSALYQVKNQGRNNYKMGVIDES
ncbi:diguanylate cyclase [Simiduia curdlanivorans]|uniref:diguanylate cyclase n=1 Tax=Simiduia curdlanivorans TaxID=1492769 RepID=A0ABV8V6K5_9GAMM|nr:diguanylate cyclase [Simiduia curdlanivorans]MDN3638898.1 diguanylate cyclase [Simiduia curdlanivorans]